MSSLRAFIDPAVHVYVIIHFMIVCGVIFRGSELVQVLLLLVYIYIVVGDSIINRGVLGM